MVYVIAQLSIQDRARYEPHTAGGRLFASDESPRVFADEPAFEAWASS